AARHTGGSGHGGDQLRRLNVADVEYVVALAAGAEQSILVSSRIVSRVEVMPAALQLALRSGNFGDQAVVRRPGRQLVHIVDIGIDHLRSAKHQRLTIRMLIGERLVKSTW